MKLEFIDQYQPKRPGRSELRNSTQYKRIAKLIKDDVIPVGKGVRIDFSKKVRREEFDGYAIPDRNMRIVLMRDFWDSDVYEIGNRRLNYSFTLHDLGNGNSFLEVFNNGYPKYKGSRRRTS